MSEANQGQQKQGQPSKPFIPQSYHLGHQEQETFDSVTIEIVPRWKESHLSGDEWRFSAVARFWVKGVEVHSQGFRNVETAVSCIPSMLHGFNMPDDLRQKRQDALAGKCDNPGCCEDATHIHHLKHRYTREGVKHDVGPGGAHRQFCERHKHRGDCALEDADHNYDVDEIGMRQ